MYVHILHMNLRHKKQEKKNKTRWKRRRRMARGEEEEEEREKEEIERYIVQNIKYVDTLSWKSNIIDRDIKEELLGTLSGTVYLFHNVVMVIHSLAK